MSIPDTPVQLQWSTLCTGRCVILKCIPSCSRMPSAEQQCSQQSGHFSRPVRPRPGQARPGQAGHVRTPILLETPSLGAKPSRVSPL
jgi:hypothetical protein